MRRGAKTLICNAGSIQKIPMRAAPMSRYQMGTYIIALNHEKRDIKKSCI